MRFLFLPLPIVTLAGWIFVSVATGYAETNSALRALDQSRATILREQIRRHAEVLADDTMEGREAGTAGGRSAATYIMRSLKESGLRPAGERGTFFQSFQAGCRNILAEVDPHGSDRKPPGADQEVIIIGAHYDHVGYGTRKTSNGPTGYIHNGADDNASGVATVLEVAEALQKYQGTLKRRVLIVFWDAEEKGLWGSKHWLKHPTVPIGKTKLFINVDMVGRLRGKLSLYGTRSLPGLRYAWTKANLGNQLALDFPWETLDNSDHYPFLKRGIPITMVHTGLHDEYHTPSDDANLLNYDGIQATAELILNFVVQAANRDTLGRVRWHSINERVAQQRMYEQPHVSAKRRLGISLSKLKSGMRIESVVVGSLADQFGLRPGDQIVQVGGEVPNDFKHLRALVARARKSVDVRLMDRGGEQRTVTVNFDEPPPRIGLSWRENDAEPNALMISSVFPDSLAEKAGIRRLDRIHKLNGQRVESSDKFRQTLTSLVGAVEILLERDGRLLVVNFEIPDSTSP